MVDATIVDTVQNYVRAARKTGIKVSRAILFGSHAKGQGLPDSDIDVVVIAPEFDPKPNRETVARLWRLRTKTDSRIEPIAVGERQWNEDTSSILIELVRRDGVEIPVPA